MNVPRPGGIPAQCVADGTIGLRPVESGNVPQAAPAASPPSSDFGGRGASEDRPAGRVKGKAAVRARVRGEALRGPPLIFIMARGRAGAHEAL